MSRKVGAHGARAVTLGTIVMVAFVGIVSCAPDSEEVNQVTPEVNAPSPTSVDQTTTDPANSGSSDPILGWVLSAEFGDGQIKVVGSGRNNTNVRIAMCLADVREFDDYLLCDVPESVLVATDSSGAFSVTLADTPFIGVGLRREADCREEECTIAVLGMGEKPSIEPKPWDVLGAAHDTIAWPESYEVVRFPVLTLDDLVLDAEANEGSVIVRGAGFAPGVEVDLVQCPLSGDGGVSAGDCVYEAGVTVVASQAGEIHAQLKVSPSFQRSDGSLVECDGSASTECYVGEPWPQPGSGNRYVMVPLTGG